MYGPSSTSRTESVRLRAPVRPAELVICSVRALDDDLDAAVVRAPLRASVRRRRAILADAVGLHLVGLVAARDDEGAHRVGPALRELHVVARRTARVAVPLDDHVALLGRHE